MYRNWIFFCLVGVVVLNFSKGKRSMSLNRKKGKRIDRRGGGRRGSKI